jgi:hypothetical protein
MALAAIFGDPILWIFVLFQTDPLPPIGVIFVVRMIFRRAGFGCRFTHADKPAATV